MPTQVSVRDRTNTKRKFNPKSNPNPKLKMGCVCHGLIFYYFQDVIIDAIGKTRETTTKHIVNDLRCYM